jgi:hypothetical protein
VGTSPPRLVQRWTGRVTLESILRTRISHPPHRQTYGPSTCAHVLRDQLVVGEDKFWACIGEKKAPQRGRPIPAVSWLSCCCTGSRSQRCD